MGLNLQSTAWSLRPEISVSLRPLVVSLSVGAVDDEVDDSKVPHL